MTIEDAIRRYENWAKDDRIDLRIRKEHEQIAEWLKELQRLRPPADRPQGKWIEYSKLVFGDGSGFCDEYEQAWKCSECGHDDGWLEWNFCPNCGARMKGADDE